MIMKYHFVADMIDTTDTTKAVDRFKTKTVRKKKVL